MLFVTLSIRFQMPWNMLFPIIIVISDPSSNTFPSEEEKKSICGFSISSLPISPSLSPSFPVSRSLSLPRLKFVEDLLLFFPDLSAIITPRVLDNTQNTITKTKRCPPPFIFYSTHLWITPSVYLARRSSSSMNTEFLPEREKNKLNIQILLTTFRDTHQKSTTISLWPLASIEISITR